MKGAMFLGGLGLVLLVTPSARGQGGHYGSAGVQAGFYRYPAPGGSHAGSFGIQMGLYRHPAAAAGYAPGYSPGYAPMMMAPAAGCSGAGYAPMMMAPAAPSYGYAPVMAAPGYAPMMMAPAAGCSGAGFAPMMMAPSYGYAPAYGYAAPQAGLLQFVGAVGGVRDTIKALKDIRDAFDDLGFGGGGADFKKMTEKLDAMEKRVNAIPPDLTTRLNKIDESLLNLTNTTIPKINADIGTINDRLKKQNIP